jgi:hypothetical protein
MELGSGKILVTLMNWTERPLGWGYRFLLITKKYHTLVKQNKLINS